MALAIGLLLGPSAPAAVDTIGSVTIFGGDPSDDGPVVPTAGNLLIPTTDVVLIGDLSQLTVDGGSLLQAGGIRTDVSSTSSVLTASGTGTTLELLGTGSRIDLFGASSASILDGAIVDAGDTAGCTSATCSVVIGGVTGSDASLQVAGAGSRLHATSAILVGIANVSGTSDTDPLGRLVIESGGGIAGFVDYQGNSGLEGLDLYKAATGVRFKRRL